MLHQHLIAAIAFFIFAMAAYPASGAFIRYFWDDAKEEAEMILADPRSKKEFSKALNWQYVIGLFAFYAILYILISSSPNSDLQLMIKLGLVMYFGFLALIDIRTMILPDMLNYIGIWSGVLIACLGLNPMNLNPMSSVIGAIGGYMVCWFIIHTGYKLFKAPIMGHGDAKYLAMLGAWFGFAPAYLIFFSASILAGTMQLLRLILIVGERKPVPFAPFLVLSACTLLVYNNQIIGYAKQIMPSIF